MVIGLGAKYTKSGGECERKIERRNVLVLKSGFVRQAV
jgi:hypothetical protein